MTVKQDVNTRGSAMLASPTWAPGLVAPRTRDIAFSEHCFFDDSVQQTREHVNTVDAQWAEPGNPWTQAAEHNADHDTALNEHDAKHRPS